MATWSVSEWNVDYDDLCEECHDCCGDNDYDDCCESCQECGCRGREDQAKHHEEKHYHEHHKPNQWNTNNTGGVPVNTTIAKLFEKTADAVLVQKYFGHQIAQNEVTYIMLNGKQKELLAAAQALQDKQDANAKVVMAQIVA